jgi:hypothetical protein
MTNRNKTAGDRYEREAQALLRDLLGLPDARRALGAGRKDDIGDIHAVPDTTIQVVGTQRDDHISTVAKKKLTDVELQRRRAGNTHSAVWMRLRGGEWRVLIDPLEAKRLGVAAGLLAPATVPAAIAVRHFAAVWVGTSHAQVVYVHRLDCYAMLPPQWAHLWHIARATEAGSRGVNVA